ncbi:MAG: hypothetical protein WAL59_04945, partial [Roseiarcus sp.]
MASADSAVEIPSAVTASSADTRDLWIMMDTFLPSHVGGPKWLVALVRFARAGFPTDPFVAPTALRV